MSLPMINDELSGETYTYREPGLTYRLNETDVAGRVDRLDAIRQAVYHILMTERYSNAIYGSGYGVELEQYVGRDFGFILANIQNTLEGALLQDDRITSVVVNDVSRSGEQQNACVISFTVYTIYGDFQGEMSLLT